MVEKHQNLISFAKAIMQYDFSSYSIRAIMEKCKNERFPIDNTFDSDQVHKEECFWKQF